MILHTTDGRELHLRFAHPAGYRPDIDGLRAIAVMMVIGFHAFPSIFKGGFVGVDIFFVIARLSATVKRLAKPLLLQKEKFV